MELKLEKNPQCLSRSRKSVTVRLLTANAVEHDVEVEESKKRRGREFRCRPSGHCCAYSVTIFLLHFDLEAFCRGIKPSALGWNTLCCIPIRSLQTQIP